MAQYVHFGIFLITVPNLIVIGLMLLVFALAVALPIPQGHPEPIDQVLQPAFRGSRRGSVMTPKMSTNWTLAVRQRLAKNFPPDQVLPDKQPSFVRSAVYLSRSPYDCQLRPYHRDGHRPGDLWTPMVAYRCNRTLLQ